MEHHAYMLVGSSDWALSMLQESGVHQDEDTTIRTYEKLVIDDARELVRACSLTPVIATHRIFVLMCSAFTLEAQNALLKLFEDPPQTAQFYLVVPSASLIIPTLRSRLSLLAEERMSVPATAIETVRSFCKAPYTERLTLAQKLAATESALELDQFLNALESELHGRSEFNALRDVLFVRTLITGPGASKKMLLEHLSLSLPQWPNIR